MSRRGSRYLVSVVAAAGTLVCAGVAVADHGGEPNGGREDRPQPQGPPAAQQEPQETATPPGQEQRPATAPAPPGQERRSTPRPRRAEDKPPPRAAEHSREKPRSPVARHSGAAPRAAQELHERPGQDKTTICHATGSQTNPFVEITIANPALPAHRRHGDLVPAPAGGCPGGSSERSRAAIDICHATGSETNPYVLLEDMPLPSLNGHGDHEGDIIPAPAGGCPASQQPAGTLTEDVPPAALAPRDSHDPPPAAGELRSSPDSTGDVPVSGVLGATAEAPAQSGVLPAGTGTDDSGNPGGSLPFTGLQLLLLVALGAGALAGGHALRRGGAVRPV